MLVKAGIAAALLMVAGVSLSRVDYRNTYNEMYPVNGLRRDVLGLCHQARPTFIRALRSDRVGCYDSMPDAVDLAIGWVRTSDRLAALQHAPTPIDAAEKVLAEAIIRGQVGAVALRRFTGFAPAPLTLPCRPAHLASATAAGLNPAFGESDAALAHRIDGAGALAALRWLPRAEAAEFASAKRDDVRAPLPVLPLAAGMAGSGSAAPPAPNAAAATAGCRTST